ncbi:STAS domain-containing protein [Kitasatospora paranensis]|uniref:STAS domain-containing protein n=1 Tax=Kitasatospora paranensis TaxID=258053 RepID=UPI00361187BA
MAVAEPDPFFTVTVRDSLAGPVLECQGELEPDTANRLRTALDRALASLPVPPMLMVDLSAVTFMDSSGLNTLLRARMAAVRQGTIVHLARPSHPVVRVLRITGTDRLFDIDQDAPAVVPRTRTG